MRKDNFHQNIYRVAVNTTVVAGDGDTVGNVIDRKNHNPESLTIVMQMGAYTTGDAQLKIEHSDDNITYTAVDAECDLLGTEAATNLSAANTTAKIGYRGIKRYIRATIVGANTAAFTVGALAVLSDLHHQGDAVQVR